MKKINLAPNNKLISAFKSAARKAGVTKAAPTRSMPTLQDRAKMAMKARSMGPKARPMASRAMRNRPSLAQPRTTRKAR